MIDQWISLRSPIPELGKYTIAEDFAVLMIKEILEKKPQVVIEAGSGISTIFMAYCFEKLGQGKSFSLEHLEPYAVETRRMLHEHKFTDSDAKILHTPLCEYKIKNDLYQWYNINDVSIPKPIDMIIVDGPPRKAGKLARYPILPLLHHHLSESAIILLDDANRDDEQAIVKLWLSEFPTLKYKRFNTQKGAVKFSC